MGRSTASSTPTHLNDAKVLAETMQGGSVMTHQDNARIRNPDDPWQREWGTGSMVAGIVAIVIMAGILAYGATRATDLPTGVSTMAQPSTSG